MWKDCFNRKVVAPVYDVYEIDGLNQDRLIKKINREKITLYNIRKSSPNSMTFCISVKQSKNFFALVKKMWYTTYDDLSIKQKKKREKLFLQGVIATKKECGYNIRRIKTKGRGYPLYRLTANIGVAIGIVVFVLGCYISNDYLLSFSYVGNGKILEREVQDLLQDKGIKRFTKFSSLDLDLLAKEIHAQNPMLSFVQCYKRGNKLVVELALASTDNSMIDNTVQELKTDVSGVVSSIRVHRGTPLVSVGDIVNQGDLLVGGFSQTKDGEIPVNVLATVVVLAEYQHEYLCEFDGKEQVAELLARGEFNGLVESAVVQTIKTEQGFLYKTTLYYKKYFVAG